MSLRNLKLAVSSLFVGLFVVALPLVTPSVAYAQVDEATKQAACEGIGVTGAECDDGSASGSINNIVATVVNILSWIVGVAAVIMIIIGGFRYVIAGGDSSAVSSAKNTIMYAIIGLVVAAVAQILVQFVLGQVTDEPTTNNPSGNSVNLCVVDSRGNFVSNPDPSRQCAMP